MLRRYHAFVLRHWQFTDGRERVEVQHLASGEVRRFRSLSDAYEWIERQDARVQAEPTPEHDGVHERPRSPPRLGSVTTTRP